jgi:molecular chaperone DnaJ
MKDYYKILGIDPASSPAEVKKAYRLLALRHHPDRNEGDTTSEERFKDIAESYEILGDTSRRQDYDYLLSNPGKAIHTDPRAKKTAATFLIIFKDIKSKVFNAGGHVNKYALYKVMDDVLSDENIAFLSRTGDTCTINLIIDEILVAGVFLSDTSRLALHDKLLLLANGDPRTLQKIAVLKEKSGHEHDTPEAAHPLESNGRAYFFILLILFIILALAL